MAEGVSPTIGYQCCLPMTDVGRISVDGDVEAGVRVFKGDDKEGLITGIVGRASRPRLNLQPAS